MAFLNQPMHNAVYSLSYGAQSNSLDPQATLAHIMKPLPAINNTPRLVCCRISALKLH